MCGQSLFRLTTVASPRETWLRAFDSGTHCLIHRFGNQMGTWAGYIQFLFLLMDDGSLLAATMALSVSGIQTLGSSSALHYKVIPRLRDLSPSLPTIDKSSRVVWIRSFASGLNHHTKNRSLPYTSRKTLTPPLHSRATRLSSLPATLLTTPFTQHQHWMDTYPSGTLPTSYGSMSHLFIPSTFSNCLQIDLLSHLQMVLRAHGWETHTSNTHHV